MNFNHISKNKIKDQLSTQGWNSVIFDPECVKHTIYFYDMVSGHLQISSLTNSREVSTADIAQLTNLKVFRIFLVFLSDLRDLMGFSGLGQF